MKTFIRILIGLIFIVSGLAKAVDTQTFVGLLHGYDIGFLAYVGIVIPPLEIILGLILWLNIEVKTTALVVVIITAMFTLIFMEVLLTKGIKDCGCFGSIKFLQMPPWATVLRNICVLAAAYFLYRFPPASSTKGWKAKFVILTIIGLFAFTIASVSFTKPLVNLKTINNEDLTSRDINSTPFGKFKKFDPTKRYAIYMFSPLCYHCWDMTANVKSLTPSGLVDETIAFIPFDLMAELKDYQEKMKPNFKIEPMPGKVFNDVTTVTPVLIIVKNNVITLYNNTGLIHSGFTTNKFLVKKDK
jgi:hypothetical protein